MERWIVVLQRGWVVVGDLRKEGTEFVLTNGSCIRQWGTSRGLGELAEKGRQPRTILDPITETRFHELTVVKRLRCSNAWYE